MSRYAPEDLGPNQTVNLSLLRTTRAALWLIEKYQELIFLTRDNQFNDDDTALLQNRIVDAYCEICNVDRERALAHISSLRRLG